MKLQTTIKNNSPQILLTLGIGGFISAIVYTAKVAPRARDILEEMPPEASNLDRAKSVAPVYAPVAGLVLLSTGAIFINNRILYKRYAALMFLYSFTDQMLERWKDAALEEVGQKNFKKIKDKVISSDEEIPETVEYDGSRPIFWDLYSKRFFTSDSVETVRKVVNNLNDTMYREDYVELNDFYFGVGLEGVEYGEEVGWHIEDGPIEVVFDGILKDDRPYISLEFRLRPRNYAAPRAT